MREDQARISLIWLWLLELIAVLVTAGLYIGGVLAGKYILFVLAGAVLGAAAVFGVVSVTTQRRHEKKNSTLKFEINRADDRDRKVEEFMQLGRQMLSEQRYAEAARMFQEILGRNTRNWQAHNYLGRAYSCQGLYEQAKDAYEKAISLEYNYASAHFNLATAHEKLGETDRALESWRRYLEVGQAIGEKDDWLRHARERIATLEKKSGGRDEADGDFEWHVGDEDEP